MSFYTYGGTPCVNLASGEFSRPIFARDEPYVPHPFRIQRRRTAGYRSPANAVYVGRPSKWGNPFPTASEFRAALIQIWTDCDDCKILERGMSRDVASQMFAIATDVYTLRGRQLACWCSLGKECHADVLADYANATPKMYQRRFMFRRLVIRDRVEFSDDPGTVYEVIEKGLSYAKLATLRDGVRLTTGINLNGWTRTYGRYTIPIHGLRVLP